MRFNVRAIFFISLLPFILAGVRRLPGPGEEDEGTSIDESPSDTGPFILPKFYAQRNWVHDWFVGNLGALRGTSKEQPDESKSASKDNVGHDDEAKVETVDEDTADPTSNGSSASKDVERGRRDLPTMFSSSFSSLSNNLPPSVGNQSNASNVTNQNNSTSAENETNPTEESTVLGGLRTVPSLEQETPQVVFGGGLFVGVGEGHPPRGQVFQGMSFGQSKQGPGQVQQSVFSLQGQQKPGSNEAQSKPGQGSRQPIQAKPGQQTQPGKGQPQSGQGQSQFGPGQSQQPGQRPLQLGQGQQQPGHGQQQPDQGQQQPGQGQQPPGQGQQLQEAPGPGILFSGQFPNSAPSDQSFLGRPVAFPRPGIGNPFNAPVPGGFFFFPQQFHGAFPISQIADTQANPVFAQQFGFNLFHNPSNPFISTGIPNKPPPDFASNKMPQQPPIPNKPFLSPMSNSGE